MFKILPNNDPPVSKPWYADGLRFACTECGKCCTGSPGYVWITVEEIERMAVHLELSIEEFSRLYVRRVKDRLSLIEHPKTYDCVFLKGKQCQIYSVRPTQCRTFPWWPQNLKSEKDWQEAARYCEGIQLDAPVVPFEKIDEQLAIQEGRKTPYDTSK